MTEQLNLWDRLEAGDGRQEFQQRAERARVRQNTVKRLRLSGRWLTLLRVARTIPQPFTLNDISVAVWRACPDFFGMKGYPYPDNHKVHYILYGDRGLIARGLITRVDQGLFRLPENMDVEKLEAGADSKEEGYIATGVERSGTATCSQARPATQPGAGPCGR